MNEGTRQANEQDHEMRRTTALERIATALEQMALERGADRARLFGFVNSDPNRPVDQEPPLPTPPPNLPVQPIMQPLPPVQPAAAVRYQAGMTHAAGHKPLKENNRGLYCPTKLADGTWCQFAVKAG